MSTILERIRGAFSAKSNAPEIMGVKSRGEFAAMGYNVAPAVESSWNGAKFAGGFGVTEILAPDYWTLRARSNQLFTTNLYARGLIRRLVTNEINTGLFPEALPEEQTLDLDLGSLDEWGEDVEQRFLLWAKTPTACDFKKRDTFNKLQAQVRREALIAGDILIVLQQDPITKRPAVMTVRGENVRNPLEPRDLSAIEGRGNRIENGVELDSAGRHVAFFIKQQDGTFKRVAARGSRSGRRLAWLVYGTDHRADTVRGMPLLGLILQSLKELDRYRDSAQRAAVINSMVAMFIEKGEDKPGTKPISSAAVRKDTASVPDSTAPGGARALGVTELMPGTILEELQQGEKPHAYQPNSDVDLGKFEEVIISAIAWANEIPPEILKLAFSNNYSASQAAINEFKIYLNMFRTDFGEQFCTPVYLEWFISEALLDKIGNSQKILEAWFDRANFERFTAWTLAEWSGAIKPSTDILKQAKGYGELVERGWITNGRATRETTGQKYTRNMRTLKRENELFVDAMAPIAAFEAANPGASNAITAKKVTELGDNIIALGDKLDDMGAPSA